MVSIGHVLPINLRQGGSKKFQKAEPLMIQIKVKSQMKRSNWEGRSMRQAGLNLLLESRGDTGNELCCVISSGPERDRRPS